MCRLFALAFLFGATPTGEHFLRCPVRRRLRRAGRTKLGGAANVECLDPEPQLRPTPRESSRKRRARQPPEKGVGKADCRFGRQTKPRCGTLLPGWQPRWCPGSTGAAAGGPKGWFPPHTPRTDRCPGRRRRMGPGGGGARSGARGAGGAACPMAGRRPRPAPAQAEAHPGRSTLETATAAPRQAAGQPPAAACGAAGRRVWGGWPPNGPRGEKANGEKEKFRT